MIKWTDRDDGTKFAQFRRLFCVSLPPGAGAGDDAYLVYLRKSRAMSGTELLRMAERVAAAELGARRLYLQDAAHIQCKKDEFDLGFRSLLAHGCTWYEIQGYELADLRRRSTQALLAHRADVGDAVRTYGAIRVKGVADAVERQVAALRASLASPASLASRALFFAAPRRNKEEEKEKEKEKASEVLLRARARLSVLLHRAPDAALLGPWLLSLGCDEFALFMRTMYGTRFGPGVAIAEAGGVRTPSLTEFKRANWLRRNSHRLLWVKKICP